MSIEVTIDGNSHPHTDFRVLRDRLIASGGNFAYHLASVHYAHLPLCAIANAGIARCPLDRVNQELRQRRSRFMQMGSEPLDRCVRFLKSEGMYVDILEAAHHRTAPYWSDLDLPTKLWFKLNCLYSHLDMPHFRLDEAFRITRHVIVERCWEGRTALGCLRTLYKASVTPDNVTPLDELRLTVGSLTEEVYALLDDEQKALCQGDALQDYECTCSCFQSNNHIIR
jgi:hypothetical protein